MESEIGRTWRSVQNGRTRWRELPRMVGPISERCRLRPYLLLRRATEHRKGSLVCPPRLSGIIRRGIERAHARTCIFDAQASRASIGDAHALADLVSRHDL